MRQKCEETKSEKEKNLMEKTEQIRAFLLFYSCERPLSVSPPSLPEGAEMMDHTVLKLSDQGLEIVCVCVCVSLLCSE